MRYAPDSLDGYPHRSPILAVAKYVPTALIAIAPERTQEVISLIHQLRVDFLLDDRAGFVFSAGPAGDRNHIRASVQGLEFLWSLSFAYYVIYQEWKRDPGRTGHLDFSASPHIRAAADLLHWSLRNNVLSRRGEWPPELPRPLDPDDASARAEVTSERVATELFLCACAWILHHELAHVKLGHTVVTTDSVAEERQADRAASAWILDQVPDDLVLLKRGIGIAIAVSTLAALEMESPTVPQAGLPRTHPTAAERLFNALDHPTFDGDHQVFDFAVHALKLHFDHVGIPDEGKEHETARECFEHYCLTLHRRGLASKLRVGRSSDDGASSRITAVRVETLQCRYP